ncbi:asparaginase [Streptantibioticus silvisoli]|uniref:Asparaginase n=1 Tax=Streptantibioticus silvisoli TaxID=2705255 RepID=A0ABT6W2D4_9ACTN|nr:asparaginase [Streptantibioticus silvisoli]MDI5963651.1 asparaginase [Streptantibioticus silvisoli]
MTSTAAPIPAADPATAPPVLAEVVRSGFTEGRHRGALVILGADGTVEFSLGDVTSQLFPRSSNKPMQADAMLRAGLALEGPLLALAAASHSGETFHLAGVRQILADSGVPESALRTPPDLPLDREAADAWLRAGGGPQPVLMNCSGKHAAMLAVCTANGWPLDSYLDPGHPLQRLVLDVVTEMGGEPVAHLGTDGCGAPLMSLSLTALAGAFRSYVLAPQGSTARKVADAMRAHPEYVAGTRRHDTWLMRELPGVLSKVGAEAVQAVALPDGRALAFKIEDGATRAVGPVLARALERLGLDDRVLRKIGDSPLLGAGVKVGEVRAAF